MRTPEEIAERIYDELFGFIKIEAKEPRYQTTADIALKGARQQTIDEIAQVIKDELS